MLRYKTQKGINHIAYYKSRNITGSLVQNIVFFTWISKHFPAINDNVSKLKFSMDE